MLNLAWLINEHKGDINQRYFQFLLGYIYFEMSLHHRFHFNSFYVFVKNIKTSRGTLFDLAEALLVPCFLERQNLSTWSSYMASNMGINGSNWSKSELRIFYLKMFSFSLVSLHVLGPFQSATFALWKMFRSMFLSWFSHILQSNLWQGNVHLTGVLEIFPDKYSFTSGIITINIYVDVEILIFLALIMLMNLVCYYHWLSNRNFLGNSCWCWKQEEKQRHKPPTCNAAGDGIYCINTLFIRIVLAFLLRDCYNRFCCWSVFWRNLLISYWLKEFIMEILASDDIIS